MGNWQSSSKVDPDANGSSVKSGHQEVNRMTNLVLAQAQGSQDLYELVDLKGGGQLVQLMKEEVAAGHDYSSVVELRIRETVKKFLYNEGEGEWIPVKELVQRKRVERSSSCKLASPRTTSDCPSQEDLLSSSAETLRMSPRLRGYPNYRFVCWDIDQRGSVGETILHMCLLIGSDIHRKLAIHLIRCFPNLINDIYIGDIYYGELPLHLAIVNGDVEMVDMLLEGGSHFDQRARSSGRAFTSKDQENCRQDYDHREHTTFSQFETNYNGMCYYGEYPLSFAVSMNQAEIFKKLYEKGANPNWQDSNGNTTLHMAVIHNKMDIYKLAYSLGGDAAIKNYQGLTPLALCCLLGRKQLFDYILDLESEVFWTYGNTVCASHPLENVDSIQTVDSTVRGTVLTKCRVNTKSVVSLVVGGSDEVTNKMLDGVVVDILNNKWKNFIRYQFGFRMAIFIIYYAFLSISFSLRPGRDKYANVTSSSDSGDSCYLKWRTNEDMVRLIFEILTVIGAIYHILIMVRELSLNGLITIRRSVEDSKLKCLFFYSCLLVLLTVILRLTCCTEAEEWILVMAIITGSFHSFYYLRGFSLTGTFIVMIKRMITRDLLRFMIIYLVYIIGYAQGMLVLFDKTDDDSVFTTFAESLMSMFIMSLGEFRLIYQTFDLLDSPMKSYVGKTLFVVYMILVTLMLVNTFIAMMSQTYQMVAESKKQALRQWAKVILDIEMSTDPHSLKYMQKTYSLPLLGDEDDTSRVTTSQRILINTKKVVEGSDFDKKKKLKIKNKENKKILLERTDNSW